MNTFTREQIEGTRQHLRDNCLGEVAVTFDGRSFSYFIMPRELEPNLKNFVFRCTGAPGDGAVFGISEDVDKRFRKYAVAHEVIEFTEIGIDTPGRCAQALERELSLVPEEIRPEYLRMRRDFFADLIQYCAQKPESYTARDLDEFRQSLSRLEELVK